MFTSEDDFKIFLNAVTIDYIADRELTPSPDWDSLEFEPELATFRRGVVLKYAPEDNLFRRMLRKDSRIATYALPQLVDSHYHEHYAS